jgi:hypothetical protein
MSSLLIGLPGFHVSIYRGFERGGWEMSVMWRRRANAQRFESRWHFVWTLAIGRVREHIEDFGGPSWMPWLGWGWSDARSFDAVPSSRWTGRRQVMTGIEWPFGFRFYYSAD